MEQKCVLLRRLPTDFDVTAESIMATEYGFHEALLKLVVRKSGFKQTEDRTEIAMIKRTEKS